MYDTVLWERMHNFSTYLVVNIYSTGKAKAAFKDHTLVARNTARKNDTLETEQRILEIRKKLEQDPKIMHVKAYNFQQS